MVELIAIEYTYLTAINGLEFLPQAHRLLSDSHLESLHYRMMSRFHKFKDDALPLSKSFSDCSVLLDYQAALNSQRKILITLTTMSPKLDAVASIMLPM